MTMRPDRRRRVFAACFAGSAFALVFAVASFNYLIDPYAVFGVRTTVGINAIKPRPDAMVSEIKYIVGERARPDALILGNSRAEVGFDPQNPAFQALHLRAFNAAVPGVGIQYTASAFQRFTASGNVRLSIIGLDFADFLYSPAAIDSPPRADRASPTKTRLLALFSTTALVDSLRTLQVQRERNPATLRPDGFNPMLDYREVAAVEGYSALFRQRAQESARYLAGQPHNLYVGGERMSPGYAALRSILTTGGEKQIDLRLVIYPYHLLLMSQLRDAGLWNLFEAWKADLAALTDEARKAGARVSLWDFACPGELTSEPIPAPDDRETKMRWYWEAGHFKKELGDLVLAKVLGVDATPPAEGFGVELTAANVADRNQVCRAALAAFHDPSMPATQRSGFSRATGRMQQAESGYGER